MFQIIASNVNDAYDDAMGLMEKHGVPEESRNGPVKVLPAPLCTTILHPTERVLFHKARKANPFLHLFEAFWMLAGRRDAAFLDTYVHDFGSRFADPDGNLHGAYGHRWRNHFVFDQLDHVVNSLRRDPSSRREVLAMWDPMSDLGARKKDIPCNTHIYPRIRWDVYLHAKALDLTVCCRSNDVVWGLCGSNIVHFSVLQEYMAWMIEVEVGKLYILSNNAHVYDATAHLYDPDEYSSDPSPYGGNEPGGVIESPLFQGANRGVFFLELQTWLEDPTEEYPTHYRCDVFTDLLIPMALTHKFYKNYGVAEAVDVLPQIKHADWREAARLWLSQRPVKKEAS